MYMLRETLCRENLFEINFPVYVVKISGHFQKLLTCPFEYFFGILFLLAQPVQKNVISLYGLPRIFSLQKKTMSHKQAYLCDLVHLIIVFENGCR